MSDALASVSDVEARLGRTIDDDAERARAEALLIDASNQVRGYLRCPVPDPTPSAIVGVVASMVVRALAGPASSAPIGVQSQTAGPFSTTFSDESTSGTTWLSRMDRLALDPYRCASSTVGLVSERTSLEPPDDETASTY